MPGGDRLQLERPAQIAHLRSPAKHPHVEVRILPFSAGLVPYRGICALLNSADEEDPPVAHVEMPLSSGYLERHEDRAEYVRLRPHRVQVDLDQ